MSMTKTHDVVMKTGEYEKDGKTKGRYMKIGVLFTDNESGRMSIKLDAAPISPDWSGWLSLFDDNKDIQRQPAETITDDDQNADLPF